MYHGMYVLDDEGNPIPEPDRQKWGEWYEAAAKQSYHGDPLRVAISQVGARQISTVFLAVDHAVHGGSPILWETMIFSSSDNDPWDNWQDRYTSKADAEAGHKRIYELILAGLPPPD